MAMRIGLERSRWLTSRASTSAYSRFTPSVRVTTPNAQSPQPCADPWNADVLGDPAAGTPTLRRPRTRPRKVRSMRFATISADGVNQAAVAAADTWVPLHHIDDSLRGDILVLIGSGLDTDRLAEIQATADQVQNKFRIPFSEATYGPPYRRPRMIWGIGLNYSEHAQDLDEGTPDQPASFIKGDHTVIGPGEDIVIPRASTRTTAEAELGLIIGKTARYVSEAEAMDHVFGVCAILDQTAEDILALNPRYLTRSKNFPTFFSYGPEVVTVDELPV